jgi:hypothetical protein
MHAGGEASGFWDDCLDTVKQMGKNMKREVSG